MVWVFFAKKKILKNQFITLYPVDIYLCDLGFVSNEYMSNEKIKYLSDNYGLRIDEKSVVIGDAKNKNDLLYLGHFLNDGIDITKDCVSEETYEKNYLEKNNCKFRPLYAGGELFIVVLVTATKDINIGEEILVPYKYIYWKNKGM